MIRFVRPIRWNPTLCLVIALLLPLFFLSSCQEASKSNSWKEARLEVSSLPGISIRALQANPDSSLYFAANDGYFGKSLNLGLSWQMDTLSTDEFVPSFRSIAQNEKGVFILSIAAPALLYSYTDQGFELTYTEQHPDAFYDSMTFFDETTAIAFGDPIDNCFSILLSTNGGDTWQKVPCELLPSPVPGEAAFAASNTNIATYGSHAWIATGGAASRVLHTADKGLSWEVYETPIQSGKKMSGIYSIAFWDESNGIVVGGDWDNKSDNTGNVALTKDGGKNWELVAEGKQPDFKSCVQYIPGGEGKKIMAVGTTGIVYSEDGGYHWEKIQEEGFYTIKFINQKLAVLAGENKFGKLYLP